MKNYVVPVVPVVSTVTAALVGVLQLLVLHVWGGRHGMGLRDVLMQWDAHWMTMISEHGYSGFVMSADQTDPVQWESVAFFPGYPVLVRILAAPMAVLGSPDATYLAALLASTLCTLLLAWGVSQLAVDLWTRFRTEPPGARARAVLAVAATVTAVAAPMGVVYWMPYSESLFTALTVWALVLMLRRHYLSAGVFVLFAGLTRLTALALVLTLCVAAVVELRRWWRERTAQDADSADLTDSAVSAGFPLAAVLSPVVGSLGILGYLLWANSAVAEIGGYFAAQERGWHSGVDFGAASLRWLSDNLVSDNTGYTVSSWTIVLVALLCLASLRMLAKGRIPWQVWLPAVLLAGIVLGSDGIMHSRPRLLLIPVLLLLLPLVVRLVARVDSGRRISGGLLVAAGVLWGILGIWVSGEMLVNFDYAI